MANFHKFSKEGLWYTREFSSLKYVIPMLFTSNIREFPASLTFTVENFFSGKMDAFTCCTLYFTSTNKNWCAFLELIFLAYLFSQLLPISCSCLKSSVQESFFRESGRKENIANDDSEFSHLTVCLLCT